MAKKLIRTVKKQIKNLRIKKPKQCPVCKSKNSFKPYRDCLELICVYCGLVYDICLGCGTLNSNAASIWKCKTCKREVDRLDGCLRG